jgi:hypothetical protein
MRYPFAILLITAISAWADGRPLTWEPAHIVRVEEAVSSGVLAPTDPHPSFFDFFSDAILESDGSVVFVANRANEGVSMLGREGVYGIDRDGRPSAFVQKGDTLGEGQSRVTAIKALEMRDGVPVAQCLLEDGSEEAIVLGNVVANQESLAESAQSRAGDVSNDGLSINRVGSGGTEQLVADLSTRIPELFEGTFTGFGSRTVGFGPWVIFSGSAKTYEGLFAMNTETDKLYLLLDNLTVLGNRRVENFQIGEFPRSGADLAATVTFTDGGSGIYIFRFSDEEGNLLFGGQN